MRVHFREMLANVREIEKILPTPNPFGNYTPLEEINIKSYYILTHAEFEYFIERCVLKKINDVVVGFKTNSTPHMCILSMIFAYLKEDETIKAIRKQGNIIDLIDLMNAKYHSVVNSNNGIKPENLERLFSPLGIDPQGFMGTTLIGELTTLGVKRGDYAHNALHVHSIEDPVIARQRTLTIQRELGKFFPRLQNF